MMSPTDVDYSTSAREITDITVVREREHRAGGHLADRGGHRV